MVRRSRLWTSRDDLVYALAFDQRGRLLAGTGNHGHIFAINGIDDFTDLLKASATQITAFAAAPGGGLYASSSNLGKIFSARSRRRIAKAPTKATSLTRTSFPIGDASGARRPPATSSSCARSGNVDNPDRNWSPWTRIDLTGTELKIPPARFVQWKAVLHAGNPAPRSTTFFLTTCPRTSPRN